MILHYYLDPSTKEILTTEINSFEEFYAFLHHLGCGDEKPAEWVVDDWKGVYARMVKGTFAGSSIARTRQPKQPWVVHLVAVSKSNAN